MPSRYMTTEQREMKNCKRHTCSRCGATFSCKTKCWAHMDNDCPKRPNLSAGTCETVTSADVEAVTDDYGQYVRGSSRFALGHKGT
jgi:hypothetical protein